MRGGKYARYANIMHRWAASIGLPHAAKQLKPDSTLCCQRQAKKEKNFKYTKTNNPHRIHESQIWRQLFLFHRFLTIPLHCPKSCVVVRFLHVTLPCAGVRILVIA